MAQNINNVQYIHRPNAGAQQAPPGQTYQLPPNSLAGIISARRRNPMQRKISEHKTAMGIVDDDAGKYLYERWRDAVKDQMLARNFVDIRDFPDAEFQPIIAGMRRLLPTCDRLATASAANNVAGMQLIDEAVVQLVKDCGSKLKTTVRNRPKGAPPLGQPGVPLAQQIVNGALLPPGAPAQWGLATAGPIAGPVPQNAPPVNNPAPDPIVPAPQNAPPVNIPAQAPIVPAPQNAPPANYPAPDPIVPAPQNAPPVNNPAQAPIVLAPRANDPAPSPITPASSVHYPLLTDWNAPLGRPRAVRIVWVRHSSNSHAPRPDYRLLHWRHPHIHGVRFAELVTHDIRHLSAAIVRTIPYASGTIRYILGATGDGRRQLRQYPLLPLRWVDYIFIDNDEAVRTWLLSNPALDDPLDLFVYCRRPSTRDRAATPPLSAHNYLHEGAVVNWARQMPAPMGQMHAGAPQPQARADPGPANEAGEPQEGDASDVLLAALSGASSDVSDVGDGHEGNVGTLRSPIRHHRGSLGSRIPLAVQSLSRLNTQQSSELRRPPSPDQGDMVPKRGAPFNSENCDERKSRRLHLAREFLESEGTRKRGAEFDDENSGEPKPKRLHSCVREILNDWTARRSFAPST